MQKKQAHNIKACTVTVEYKHISLPCIHVFLNTIHEQ